MISVDRSISSCSTYLFSAFDRHQPAIRYRWYPSVIQIIIKKSEGLRSYAKKRWFFEHRLSFSTFFLCAFFVFFPRKPIAISFVRISQDQSAFDQSIIEFLDLWRNAWTPSRPTSTSMGTALLVASDTLIL